MRVTTTFDVVQQRRTIDIDCSVCGEPRRRVLKAFQTINPFNRNGTGFPKSRMEISGELPAQLDKMERELRKEGITCKVCKECGPL